MGESAGRVHRDRLTAELQALWRAAGDPQYAGLAKRVEAARHGTTPTRLPATMGDWRRGVQVPRDEELFRDVIAALNDLVDVRLQTEGIGPLDGYVRKAWPSWRKLLKEAQAERSTPAAAPSEVVFEPEPASVGQTPARPPAGRRRVLLVGAAVATVVVAAALVLPQVFSEQGAAAGTASFDSPRDQDRVASPVLAKGTAVLPDGQALWIFVEAPDGAFYPAVRRPVDVDAEGAWSVSVGLGRDADDVGLSYDLHALMVPAAGSEFEAAVAAAQETGESVRFEDLPSDATRLGQVHVTLSSRG